METGQREGQVAHGHNPCVSGRYGILYRLAACPTSVQLQPLAKNRCSMEEKKIKEKTKDLLHAHQYPLDPANMCADEIENISFRLPGQHEGQLSLDV